MRTDRREQQPLRHRGRRARLLPHPVDGGGAGDDEICQLLADLFGCDVVRPTNAELTSAGAAKAALRGVGEAADRYFGQDRDAARRFSPGEDVSYARGGYEEWVRLIETVLR